MNNLMNRNAACVFTHSLFTCLVLSLAGCGVGTGTSPTASGVAITGAVHGGQQPVSGATVSLYAAGTGTAASSLLTSSVQTDATGSFSITGDYSCPAANTQVYLTVRGGNPGLGSGHTNPALLLIAALGDCGALTASTFININELTTVAAAWALAPFTSGSTSIATSATNATGLRNAFLYAAYLTSVSSGASPGALPSGASTETTKLNTLADILASCVNSDGTTPCTALFNAVASGPTPTDTFAAAVAIAKHPATNVAALYNLTAALSPFQPALTQAPNDWTVSVTYSGSAITLPTALAADSRGRVWVANYSGGNAARIVPGSAVQSFADSALRESYGLTVDTSDRAWITDEETKSSVNSARGALTVFDANGNLVSGSGLFTSGVYFPYAIAAASDGSVWIADFGDSAASHISSSFASLTGGSAYQSQPLLPSPVSVAVDSASNAWFGAESRLGKVTPAGSITSFSCCQGAAGVAVDPSGNIWVADYSAPALVEVSSSGTVLQTLSGIAGIYYPESVAVDSTGTVWAANFHGNSFSAVSAAGTSNTSTALSPGSGFGLDAALSQPFGIALDASGSVWISSHASSAVVQFIGMAAPIATPLLGPPTAP